MMKFKTDAEVLQAANDNRSGLCASVWSTNTPRAMKLVNGLRAGTVWLNEHMLGWVDIPWGGYRESGFGKENSMLGLEDFTQVKLVVIDLNQ